MTQGNHPPPLRAIPVQAPGVSYQQMAEAYAAQYGRPGMITTIAVISIIVASLSVLLNVGMVFQAFIIYSSSRMFAAVTAPPMASLTAAQPAIIVGDEFLSPTGLGLPQRQALIEALGSLQPMNEARRGQLEALLIDSGRAMLPPDAQPQTADQARQLVRSHGRLPGLGGAEGRLFFELPLGRLEIGHDSAVFFPADGGPAVRSGGAVTGPDGSTMLSPAQVQAAIDHVQALSDNALDDVQRQALDNALRQPWQMIIVPVDSVAGIRSQIQAVERHDDGRVIIVTSQRECEVLPQGAVKVDGMVLATATGGSVAAMSSMRLSGAIAGAFVNGLLGAVLLLLGILLLRQWQPARLWLPVWSVVKLLAGAAGALAWAWFYADMASAFNDGSGAQPLKWGVAATFAAISCFWPLVLLIVLRLRSVRDYFARTI